MGRGLLSPVVSKVVSLPRSWKGETGSLTFYLIFILYQMGFKFALVFHSKGLSCWGKKKKKQEETLKLMLTFKRGVIWGEL